MQSGFLRIHKHKVLKSDKNIDFFNKNLYNSRKGEIYDEIRGDQ